MSGGLWSFKSRKSRSFTAGILGLARTQRKRTCNIHHRSTIGDKIYKWLCHFSVFKYVNELVFGLIAIHMDEQNIKASPGIEHERG